MIDAAKRERLLRNLSAEARARAEQHRERFRRETSRWDRFNRLTHEPYASRVRARFRRRFPVRVRWYGAVRWVALWCFWFGYYRRA